MEGPTTILVLSQQDLSIPLNNHACVLLEDAVGSHIEVAMAANRVSVVVHSAHKMTFVDVQVLELVTFFAIVEFIGDDLLEANTFVVQQSHQSVVVASIA